MDGKKNISVTLEQGDNTIGSFTVPTTQSFLQQLSPQKDRNVLVQEMLQQPL
jgi:hypothetical protein